MNLKSRSKSSNRWLQRQHSDPYTLQAKKQGYRSRAAFKLLEIQEKDKIFKPGMRVVDLGAAPGGWSQVASKLIGVGLAGVSGPAQGPAPTNGQARGPNGVAQGQAPTIGRPGGPNGPAQRSAPTCGKLIAVDILAIESLPGVDIIQGDFQNQEVLDELMKRLDGNRVDLVISDMAPNISGINSVDQPRAMGLAELALEFAQSVLKEEGSLLVKVFQGEGFEAYWSILKKQFRQVVIRKPKSSRTESREIYFLAKGFISQDQRITQV